MIRAYKGLFLLFILVLFISGNRAFSRDYETSGRELTRQESEIKRLKEALTEPELATKLWALRCLARYPAAVSCPVMLEQFQKPMTEDTIVLRCAIVYAFGQMQELSITATNQIVQLLTMDLAKYGWTPPEVFKKELDDFRKNTSGKKDNDPELARIHRERITESRQKMLENYNQKLNWGLLHLRTMQVVGKYKCQDAGDELHKLITAKELPIVYKAIDTLKLLNNFDLNEKLTKNSINYWQPECRAQVIYAISELSSPYGRNTPSDGSEWLKKCTFRLVADEVTKAGQTNDRLVKALNIMDILSQPDCRIYDFASETNLMKEFTDLTNMFKANNPEIMLYDYDLIIKFIKDEMLMRALYNIHGDILKPPAVIITTTPGSVPQPEPQLEKEKAASSK